MSAAERDDTDRLNWLESMGAEVCIPKTDDLLATGYLVHTHFTGWVPGDSLRGAIDNARRRIEEGGR